MQLFCSGARSMALQQLAGRTFLVSTAGPELYSLVEQEQVNIAYRSVKL
jgi:hypothetical protein